MAVYVVMRGSIDAEFISGVFSSQESALAHVESIRANPSDERDEQLEVYECAIDVPLERFDREQTRIASFDFSTTEADVTVAKMPRHLLPIGQRAGAFIVYELEDHSWSVAEPDDVVDQASNKRFGTFDEARDHVSSQRTTAAIVVYSFPR